MQRLKTVKYIGNKPERGVAYDWRLIRRELKKIGIPKIYYNPYKAPFERASWFVEVSERATGKTTGWLILAMIMFQLYGTVTIYARQRDTMIAPKNMSSLFNVIIENGYIEKITDGKYNNVYYRSKKWYFAKIDEDGNTVERSNEYFCRMVSIDRSADLKSSCNEPFGDLFIFDEFVNVDKWSTRENEFVLLMDVISTVFRLRESGKVVMLANNIDKYNQYFHDLEIFERISTMAISENCLYTTDGGTNIYIELIGAPAAYATKKTRWVKLFAGFRKPELAAITGQASWAMKCYQHIPEPTGEDRTLFRGLYIYYNNKYVRFDVVQHGKLGLCLYAHWATEAHEDSIILTRNDIDDPRYIYAAAAGTPAGKLIADLGAKHRIYFAANDVGSFVEGYLAGNPSGIRAYF